MRSSLFRGDNFVFSRGDAAVVAVAAAIVVVLLGLGFGLAASAPPPPPSSRPPSPPRSPSLELALSSGVVTAEDWARPGYAEAVELLMEAPVIDGWGKWTSDEIEKKNNNNRVAMF